MATDSFETTDGPHVAIIMDGNGRWAQRRGLPRSAGHKAGVEAARRIVEAATELGVGTLTLFAFSADNWQRPAEEVGTLMQLLQIYLRNERKRLIESETHLTVIGRRDRLPRHLSEAITRIEDATAHGTKLHLRIALDYSSREAIARAAALWPAEEAFSREAFRRLLALQGDQTEAEVDLLIRSGGEKRLSDFLLWECAYAELCFLDVMWPDFTADDFAAAIADFRRRERRFGGLGKLPNLTVAV
ncbi:MAG: di-trans,poly-cis-decaprenylcistransferase [Beijerinckiaceae bacterium]